MSDLRDILWSVNDPLDNVREYIADEDQTPQPPVDEELLTAVTGALGFPLPELLVRLYTEIGDGGFGPGYELLPLHAEEGESLLGVYETMVDPGTTWPRGVVPIIDWGCGMYAAVDCLDDRGAVLLFEPNVFSGDWAEVWFLDNDDLADWLRSWTSPTAWFSETGEAEGGPTPWADAAARLVT